MSRSGSEALQESVSRFVRIFGLLDREQTPCELDLHVAKSTVSRLVGQLIERGWLQRESTASDGRAVLASRFPIGPVPS